MVPIHWLPCLHWSSCTIFSYLMHHGCIIKPWHAIRVRSSSSMAFSSAPFGIVGDTIFRATAPCFDVLAMELSCLHSNPSLLGSGPHSRSHVTRKLKHKLLTHHSFSLYIAKTTRRQERKNATESIESKCEEEVEGSRSLYNVVPSFLERSIPS